MADEAAHVFDQTNGVIKADTPAGKRLSPEERRRRREQSSALAYGMFGTGHN